MALRRMTVLAAVTTLTWMHGATVHATMDGMEITATRFPMDMVVYYMICMEIMHPTCTVHITMVHMETCMIIMTTVMDHQCITLTTPITCRSTTL